jgi:hypothetical protein
MMDPKARTFNNPLSHPGTLFELIGEVGGRAVETVPIMASTKKNPIQRGTNLPFGKSTRNMASEANPRMLKNMIGVVRIG